MKHWKLEEILPRLMILVTRHGRHKVENIKWSSRCWTHNIFRFWEMLFWRRLGKTNNFTDTVRPHYSFDSNGTTFRVHFHTIEAAVAHFEGAIRNALAFNLSEETKGQNMVSRYYDVIKSPYFAQKNLVVQLVFSSFILTLDSSKIGTFFPIFIGAVAHNGSGAGSDSCSITTSGTNRLLLAQIEANPGSFTYNSVELSQLALTTSTGSPGFYGPSSSYMLAAPSTGTNTLTSSSGNAKMAGSCYTGALQSTPAVEQITTTTSNSQTITGSLTTDVDNSFVWAGVTNSIGDGAWTQDAGTGSTQRAKIDGNSSSGAGSYDNGSAKTPVGAVSMTVTRNSPVGTSSMIMHQQQVAPAPTTAIKTFNGLAYASIKTVDGLAIASVKTIDGLA